jgi:hypothetical protein
VAEVGALEVHLICFGITQVYPWQPPAFEVYPLNVEPTREPQPVGEDRGECQLVSKVIPFLSPFSSPLLVPLPLCIPFPYMG